MTENEQPQDTSANDGCILAFYVIFWVLVIGIVYALMRLIMGV